MLTDFTLSFSLYSLLIPELLFNPSPHSFIATGIFLFLNTHLTPDFPDLAKQKVFPTRDTHEFLLNGPQCFFFFLLASVRHFLIDIYYNKSIRVFSVSKFIKSR